MTNHRAPHRLTHVAFGLIGLSLAGCSEAEAPQKADAVVRARTVELVDYAPRVELTGEIRAQVQSDLSFRVSGRVIARNADVGDRVAPEQMLAQLDPQEQDANVRAAEANMQAAEAQLRQSTSAFERQRTLLGQGFTTRRDYDQAEQAFRTAQGSLDAARAQLETARQQLSYTTLRAGLSGIVTARNVEVGQVVQAAQTVFTAAQDGPRDAVFNIQESLLGLERIDDTIDIALVSDPAVRAAGRVREVSPTVDPANGTVRVKIGIERTPPAMALGAAVRGAGRFKPRRRVVLPWSALSSLDGKPAVWIVEPQTKAVSLRPIAVDVYRAGELVVRDGVRTGEIVVTAGAQLLHPGQRIALAPEAAP